MNPIHDRRAFLRIAGSTLPVTLGLGRAAAAGRIDGYTQVAAIRLPGFKPTSTLTFSPDGKRLAVGVRVIDIESRTDLGPVILQSTSQDGVQRMYFLEDSREFIGCLDGNFVHGRVPDKLPPAAEVVPVSAYGNKLLTNGVYKILAAKDYRYDGSCQDVHRNSLLRSRRAGCDDCPCLAAPRSLRSEARA